ncbi:MAG: preprotein translocase subunit SecY [Clostridiales bacterium]|jgi:preprotein translocase subunit SecY|nr:preprotein translocase subunit SecY [Clostridiales bacterium]MDR2711738.1 preprotein translocase subunit SecY [Clostridiales bacterium]
MLSSLSGIWKVEELRKKIMFTLLMFLIFRLGAHVPIPGIDPDALSSLMGAQIFGWLDIVSGGSLKRFTVFAMGIIPYINASIILNLLTMVIPYFEKLQKEGPEGRKKMTQYTRYGTVVLGLFQAFGMSMMLRSAFTNPSWASVVISTISLTAGTAFLMWLGELITEKGIGNGISLIIFAGIVSRIPTGAVTVWNLISNRDMSIITVLLFLILAILVIAGIVTVQEAQRKIPVQYAKRVVGRKTYGGQSTHVPIKINQAGVIPIIFAMSILMIPSMFANFFPEGGFSSFISKIFNMQHPVYVVTYGLLILVFTYFYTAVTFNTNDVADNLKKYGGFIPGLRPGRPTAEYLDRVLSRITFAGAIFLTLIAIMPSIAMAVSGQNFSFGGTSLLIAVGVALDTMKQIESHLLLRHYEGFMR